MLKVKKGNKNTDKGKYSQRNGGLKVVEWGSVSQRLFLINIGSNNGLLYGVQVLYNESAGTGDNHGRINSMHFESMYECRSVAFYLQHP